jgi:malate dehydrogenase
MDEAETDISIIGTGRLGGEIAFLLASKTRYHLVLHDTYSDILEGQRKDILDAYPTADISTNPADIRNTDILIFTAGFPRRADMSRADLLQNNLGVVNSCLPLLKAFEGIIIVATNPVDALTYYIYRRTGNPRIVGFGNQVDSARLGLELKKRGYKEQYPEADSLVIGEHGDHMVPIFLEKLLPEQEREEILKAVIAAGPYVIAKKGGTIFGPARHVANLVQHIVYSRPHNLPCSVVVDDYAIGQPVEFYSTDGPRPMGGFEYLMDGWESKKYEEATEYLKGICKSLS